MSKDSIQHESVKQYVRQVCGHVKAREVHPDIQLEITGHLDELVEDKLGDGLSVEEATRQALAQMGDPDQIGKRLHAAHKPVMEWGLAALVAIMVGIGLLAVYALQFAYGEQSTSQFFFKKVLYTAIGVVLVIGIYFMDYRKWRKYSWYLYSGTVLLMVACNIIGTEINGMKRWIAIGAHTIDVYGVSPYLFMIAFAGMLMDRKTEKLGSLIKSLHLAKMILLYAFVPTFLYSQAHSFHDFIVYGFGLMILMLYVAKKYKVFFISLASLAFIGITLLTLNPFRYQAVWHRYTALLNPNASNDSLYVTHRSIEAILSGGMWGQGFGAKNTMIPFVQSEMVFTYLMHSLGWVFGFCIVVLTLILIGKAFSVASMLKDPYARGLVVGLFSVIGMHFGWNILMSLGLLPITAMTMPFVSYGGTNGIIELMAMGLILSVHRRRNMISRLNSEAQA
ncbi:FtsW/RodA/SpoVE family cell cycle protein [Paenibacillus sp. PL91]|uniref:FtsW/RodA/SpoVE family cell cycle protein n=1 Tax=Paenibacillus sp. PL91 TaxID=2729538 RepID=UPI00145F470F|nr:FtsW/RodA/SpoVE family cell cycle protein [Paenibacillus sp. PL91]MBC9204304.1 FtsW/RodA/SpoVE family cell cycle protein [Paenibacillus sp. PL91]